MKDSGAGVARLEGCSILVVEDDYYQADDTRRICEQAGAAVIGPFASMAEALRAIDSHSLDCALIDLNLGGGPSFELTYALKERAIPVLILSGYDSHAVPFDLQDLRQLDKPVDRGTLLAAVSALLERTARTAASNANA